jgi:hypothetical protein
MLIVPVQATPNQTFSVLLGGQSCQITLNTREDGRLYFSLTVNNTDSIVNNVVCENINRLVRYAYLGFIGDFWFLDTEETRDINGNVVGADPDYTGLGGRYLLQYIETSDLAA